MKKLLTWLASSQWRRVCLWGAAALITLLVLVYQIENYRGAKAWQKTLHILEQENVSLDFAELAPQPVPDNQNFGAIPLLKDIAIVIDEDMGKGEPGKNLRRLAALDLRLKEDSGKIVPGPGKGHALGVAPGVEDAWEDFFASARAYQGIDFKTDPARGVLEALSRHDDLFAELVASLDRPHAQLVPSPHELVGDGFTFDLLMPQYPLLSSASKTLALRASAAALAGEGDIAAESILTGLRLAHTSLNDGILIGMLSGIAQVTVAEAALWHALEARVLSPEQLTLIQEELGRFDFSDSLLAATHGELTFMSQAYDYMSNDPSMFLGLIEKGPGHPSGLGFFASVAPAGWFQQNRAFAVQRQLEHVLLPLRDGGYAGLFEEMNALEDELESCDRSHPYRVLACLITPVFDQIAPRIVYADALCELSIAACAVERYQLERDSYPMSLEDLLPDYLDTIPDHPLTGEPMRYMRFVDDGRFRLWFYGWDDDDGGRRALQKKDPEKTRFHAPSYQGDWVWSYAGDE